MRVIAVVATLLDVFPVFINEAHADGKWCARYPEGSSNCGHYSFAQCQATVSGRADFSKGNGFSVSGTLRSALLHC
jgi:hypothetical protein